MSDLDNYAEFLRERGKLMAEIERLRGLVSDNYDGPQMAQKIMRQRVEIERVRKLALEGAGWAALIPNPPLAFIASVREACGVAKRQQWVARRADGTIKDSGEVVDGKYDKPVTLLAGEILTVQSVAIPNQPLTLIKDQPSGSDP